MTTAIALTHEGRRANGKSTMSNSLYLAALRAAPQEAATSLIAPDEKTKAGLSPLQLFSMMHPDDSQTVLQIEVAATEPVPPSQH